MALGAVWVYNRQGCVLRCGNTCSQLVTTHHVYSVTKYLAPTTSCAAAAIGAVCDYLGHDCQRELLATVLVVGHAQMDGGEAFVDLLHVGCLPEQLSLSYPELFWNYYWQSTL